MSTLAQIHTFLEHYFGDALSYFLALLYGVRASESDVESETTSSDILVGAECPDGPDNDFIVTDINLDHVYPEEDPFRSRSVHFGSPSNEYHDRRLPLGTVTNIPQANKSKTSKAKTVRSKVVNWSLPTGALRSRPSPATSLSSPADVPEDFLGIAGFPVAPAVNAAPTPGSVEWNNNKTALLAQVRSWSNQVKASRRNSTHVPRPATVSSPRLDLEGLLSSLILEAQETIAGLDAKELTHAADKDISTFSAVDVSNQRASQACAAITSKSGIHTGLISSISASRSMAALSSASSRSLSDLLAAFDEVLAGPSWRRLLSRSDLLRA
ncbi:hypothetical protein B0H17DRAFT_1102696, partial [Mycena rosella]